MKNPNPRVSFIWEDGVHDGWLSSQPFEVYKEDRNEEGEFIPSSVTMCVEIELDADDPLVDSHWTLKDHPDLQARSGQHLIVPIDKMLEPLPPT